MSYTKGPWKVKGKKVNSNMGHIALCYGVDKIMGGSTVANALLIAAAPDLLEACKILIGFESGEINDSAIKANEVMERIKQAISKAEPHRRPLCNS